MKFLFLFFFFCFPGVILAQDQWKNIYVESAWPERDVWQKADSIIQTLILQSGSVVADIGCHEGYMTFKLSKVVGVNGRVYAVDIEPNRLEKLKANLQTREIDNVTVVKSEYDDPKLPANALDAALIIDAYHEMKSHDIILSKIKASLKPGGRLVICEPIAENRRGWSREKQAEKHELLLSFALKDLRKAGFQILFQQDRFIDREKIKGDKMWLVVAASH